MNPARDPTGADSGPDVGVTWIGSAPDEPGTPTPPARRDRRRRRIAIGTVSALVAAGVITGSVLLSTRPPAPADVAEGAPSARASPPPTPAPPRAPSTPAKTTSVLDAPNELGARAKIVRSSEGSACRNSQRPGAYGGYPAAECKLWKSSTGLLTGERADQGNQEVACQRNLGRSNPVFAKGQANTWWVWMLSDAGTWDWFPETAVAEGASSQPINGIALCSA